MKKIINIFILLVVCLLPVVVEAEDSFELEYEIFNELFLYEENGRHYYINYGFESYSPGFDFENTYLKSYDSKGEDEKQEAFFGGTYNEEFLNSRKYKALVEDYTNFFRDNIYYNNIFYTVNYTNEMISYTDSNNQIVSFEFNDDINLTKKVLGNRHDIYLNIKDKYENIIKIDIFENIYVVYYKDENYENKTDVYNKNNQLIISVVPEGYRQMIYVKEIDGIIYVMSMNTMVKTYKLDGTLIDTLEPSSRMFDKAMPICGSYTSGNIHASNGRLFLTYYFFDCDAFRIAMNDETDVLDNGKFSDYNYSLSFTQVYTLNYDVIEKQTDGGTFTHEEKVDEDGNSYIQLNIKPEDGYIVEDIIVTDINGNRIEVTDSRFLKPMNDVVIEIKYTNGEYLPIPDTFMGMDIKVLIIGILLIVVGSVILYTNMNTVNEK